jgi:hypothetical protein
MLRSFYKQLSHCFSHRKSYCKSITIFQISQERLSASKTLCSRIICQDQSAHSKAVTSLYLGKTMMFLGSIKWLARISYFEWLRQQPILSVLELEKYTRWKNNAKFFYLSLHRTWPLIIKSLIKQSFTLQWTNY